MTAKLLRVLILCSIFTALSCSVQKMAMKSVVSYTKDDAIPYLMTQSDVNSAAAMGEAFVPLIASMTRLKIDNDEVIVASAMASGMSAEALAREAELRRIRAIRENNPSQAQDALIAEKQSHALAARRFFTAYTSALSAYGDLAETCPKFKEENSEMLALLGLASGALAILHDFNAEKSVGISLDVPVKIEKAARCFDNAKWWGLPTALRASIWLSIPGSGSENEEALASMKEAAAIGDAAGVTLARALWAQMAKSVGNTDNMCEALQGMPTSSANPHDYALLSAYAQQVAQHQADVLWTQKEGHRAPFGTMSCPQESENPVFNDEFDDLLEGLGAPDVLSTETLAPD
ncbi:MAG: hypothetical protein WC966_03425 [Bradymonadales bacterium]